MRTLTIAGSCRLRFAALLALVALGGCAPHHVQPIDAGPPPQDWRPESSVTHKEELANRCSQLARATPGVEQFRIVKDGAIETREWALVTHDSAPRWAIVRAKDAPPDAWSPKPGITRLNFKPPLATAPGSKGFIAYAPLKAEGYDEGLKITTLNQVFGGSKGTFDWRGRSYGYVIARELPCYPQLR